MGKTAPRELDQIRERWNREETWSVTAGEQTFVSYYRAAAFQLTEIDPVVAAVGELVSDGATATDLHRLAKQRSWPSSLVERGRRKLANHLGLK